MPDWVWDHDKDRQNRKKHSGLSLADGVAALQDRAALSRPDPHSDGDRWQTLGLAAGLVCLFVVHTDPVPDEGGNETGRIISVRKAERRERSAYEARDF